MHLDENCASKGLVDLLTADKFDVSTPSQEDKGEEDHVVFDRLRKEADRLLVTMDKDFLNITTYPPTEYGGALVVITPSGAMQHRYHRIIERLLVEDRKVVVGMTWRVEISVHGEGDEDVSFRLFAPTVEDVSWGNAKQKKTDRAKEKRFKEKRGARRGKKQSNW